jgi:hypothetical protein
MQNHVKFVENMNILDAAGVLLVSQGLRRHAIFIWKLKKLNLRTRTLMRVDAAK